MYEKNAYETLRWVVARSYTGVDTWTLMMKPEARQKAFLESMIRLCKEEGARLWTTDYVLRNVDKMLEDESYADTARRARDFVEMMRREGWMQVFVEHPQDEESRFYRNPDFLADVLAYTCKDAALLTQESGVACEVLNLGGMRLGDGRCLRVFRITGNGKVGRFNFLRDREGRFVLPKNSGLYAPAGTVVTQEPSQSIQVCEADALFDKDGNRYAAATLLNGENPMAQVEGQPERMMMLITSHIHYAYEKCKLLMENGFPCPEAILPEELLYDELGNFAGYVFRRPEGVALKELFDPALHEELERRGLETLDREWYAALAVTIAQAAEDFRMGGVTLLHLNPDNIWVGLDDQGRPDCSKVSFLRMEDAQFGSEETGMFPASRSVLGSDYAAPEMEGRSMDPHLYGQEQLIFTVSLVCLYVLLGVYPYEQEATLPNAAGETARHTGQFGFSVYCSGLACLPQMQNWQALNGDLRQFFYDLLDARGKFCCPSNRPAMNQLLRRLRTYLAQMRSTAEPERLQMHLPKPAFGCVPASSRKQLPEDDATDAPVLPQEEVVLTMPAPSEMPAAQRSVRGALSRMLRWLADRLTA